jgi:hypothetical protein
VTDQTGAVVPNAKVTLTNDGTNISSSATTDGHGQYVFNGIRPAAYTLKVESGGFQESVQKNVVLALAQQASLDVVLKPSGSTLTMTVTDTAPLLDLTGASLGDGSDQRIRQSHAAGGPPSHQPCLFVRGSYGAE